MNAKLQSRGLSFENIDCSFRQIEITIPRAKLSNPISYQAWKGKDDAVVVVVIDGIHLLARTNLILMMWHCGEKRSRSDVKLWSTHFGR